MYVAPKHLRGRKRKDTMDKLIDAATILKSSTLTTKNNMRVFFTRPLYNFQNYP